MVCLLTDLLVAASLYGLVSVCTEREDHKHKSWIVNQICIEGLIQHILHAISTPYKVVQLL